MIATYGTHLNKPLFSFLIGVQGMDNTFTLNLQRRNRHVVRHINSLVFTSVFDKGRSIGFLQAHVPAWPAAG